MEETAARIVPNILSLAGVDPSGGAGLLADIKTISALGGYACGAVTALTVQNTRGVSGVRIMSGDFVSAQMESVLSDIRIDAVKIGMLGNCEVIEAAAGILRDHPVKHVVLDTILASTSGTPLLEPEAVGVLIRKLLPLCTVFTPNLPEAAILLGDETPADEGGMENTARRLWNLAGCGPTVYLKGGHLSGDRMVDLVFDGKEVRRYESSRVKTENMHGTGCALSSAIAALLPQRCSAWEAFSDAHDYLRGAIQAADRLSVGSGHGPVNHFWQK
jgi:hydroxymethylpyrimidine/phosphomethylpyrimidine kinase